MECRELTARELDRRLGEADEDSTRELERHLEGCAACRAEASAIEETWVSLGEDQDVAMTPEFKKRSLLLIEEEMMRRRIRAFRPKPRLLPALARVAALFVGVLVGYLVAKGTPGALPVPPPTATVAARADLPDLSEGPRLSNVAYRPADSEGRIGISFEVTSRKDVLARPEDPSMAKLLAYLVAQNAETAGERSRAIELVSANYGASQAPASPDIVRALTGTLQNDRNPGVRKKAAEALATFRMSPEIRGAFLHALKNDRNPAIRLVAVERLAAAAKESPDAQTIETLRERAFDSQENGFVRAKAANALKAIDL